MKALRTSSHLWGGITLKSPEAELLREFFGPSPAPPVLSWLRWRAPALNPLSTPHPTFRGPSRPAGFTSFSSPPLCLLLLHPHCHCLLQAPIGSLPLVHYWLNLKLLSLVLLNVRIFKSKNQVTFSFAHSALVIPEYGWRTPWSASMVGFWWGSFSNLQMAEGVWELHGVSFIRTLIHSWGLHPHDCITS